MGASSSRERGNASKIAEVKAEAKNAIPKGVGYLLTTIKGKGLEAGKIEPQTGNDQMVKRRRRSKNKTSRRSKKMHGSKGNEDHPQKPVSGKERGRVSGGVRSLSVIENEEQLTGHLQEKTGGISNLGRGGHLGRKKKNSHARAGRGRPNCTKEVRGRERTPRGRGVVLGKKNGVSSRTIPKI